MARPNLQRLAVLLFLLTPISAMSAAKPVTLRCSGSETIAYGQSAIETYGQNAGEHHLINARPMTIDLDHSIVSDSVWGDQPITSKHSQTLAFGSVKKKNSELGRVTATVSGTMNRITGAAHEDTTWSWPSGTAHFVSDVRCKSRSRLGRKSVTSGGIDHAIGGVQQQIGSASRG